VHIFAVLCLPGTTWGNTKWGNNTSSGRSMLQFLPHLRVSSFKEFLNNFVSKKYAFVCAATANSMRNTIHIRPVAQLLSFRTHTYTNTHFQTTSLRFVSQNSCSNFRFLISNLIRRVAHDAARKAQRNQMLCVPQTHTHTHSHTTHTYTMCPS